MKIPVSFIWSSISLDFWLFKVSRGGFIQKTEFIIKKYFELLLLSTKLEPFIFGKNYVRLFGEKVYYDSIYGIADYQSMLVRHQKMLKEAELININTIVDVGANVGFFSMMARSLYPNASIYSIEPVPGIYNCLLKNNIITKAKTFNTALSNFKGEMRMVFNDKDSAISHVVEDNLEEEGQIVNVTCVTLDSFCKDNNITNIDLLKIDTESFEASVLRGAQETLSKTRYLSIEITIENNANYTFSELNSLLFSNKYNFQLVNFRNYTNKGDGPIPVGDFFYKNILFNE